MFFKPIVKVLIELVFHESQWDQKIILEFLFNVIDLEIVRIFCKLDHVDDIFFQECQHSFSLSDVEILKVFEDGLKDDKDKREEGDMSLFFIREQNGCNKLISVTVVFTHDSRVGIGCCNVEEKFQYFLKDQYHDMILLFGHFYEFLLEFQLVLLSSFTKILNQCVIGIIDDFLAFEVKFLLIFPFFFFQIFQVSLEH